MNPGPDETTGFVERDARLAGLLAVLTESLRGGSHPEVDRLALEHPDLADELRELWAAVEIAETFGAGLAEGFEAAPPDPPTLAANDRLGDCVLLGELGRGGMGVVYRARQVGLGRDVALKRLRAGASATPADLARFRAEAGAAARLSHPNIVPLYSVESHAGEPYFLMRLVEGTTLARLLADGPLPAVEAARVLAPVCRAIQYAHEQGVLHRDVKPSNILIDGDGRPHVSDFGLAKRVDVDPGETLTQPGAILGTPSYMAPEQAAPGRGPPGPPADVYALGAVLYQALTGRPPFLAPSPFETILLVLEEDPVPPRALNPRAGGDLEMVALKCLQKSPALRYPTAGALADDLDAFLAGEPVSARSTGLRDLARRLLGETQHAPVLEHWGGLWMAHAVALVVFFGLTNALALWGVTARWPYVLIFTAGLGLWAAVFWALRRRGGPVTFIERLLAHVWGAGILGINAIFLVEWLQGLPVLSLAPLMAVTNGMLLVVKGGILSGAFYAQAAAVFLAIVPMVLLPRFAPLIFGLTSAACFFSIGLKNFRRRRLRSAPERLSPPGSHSIRW